MEYSRRIHQYVINGYLTVCAIRGIYMQNITLADAIKFVNAQLLTVGSIANMVLFGMNIRSRVQ